MFEPKQTAVTVANTIKTPSQLDLNHQVNSKLLDNTHDVPFVNISKYFPNKTPLLNSTSTNICLKTSQRCLKTHRHVTDQCTIDIIVDQLNNQTNLFFLCLS